MGIFFVYILKSSVCLVVFYLFYRLLLSRETFHRFNRVALLGILLLSCLLPLVEVTVEEQTEVHQTMMTLEQWLMLADMMNTAGATDLQAEEVTVTWIQVALLVYLAGILLFALRNGYSLLKLGGLLKSGRKENLSKYIDGGEKVPLIVHDRDIAPFSWMKYIVISQKDLDENGREILIHELAHIQNRHSWDLLVADICIFFQWFNPASWLLKQELQNIHEYEADETVIEKGVDAKQYQLLLIKKAVGTRLYSMANSFNHSKLKKRITMMLKEKSNPWARLKYLYVLPLAAIAVTAFARPEISEKVEEISAVKVNDLAEIVQEKVLQDTVKVSKDEKKDDLVVSGVKSKEEEEIVIFEVVEQMPEYPGGMSALQKYLSEKIAGSPMKGKAGGRVMVGFTVAETGKIKDVRVLQSDEASLNQEAERIVSEMPDWIPGKQRGRPVPVKYTVPIRFGNIRFAENKQPLIFADGKEISMDAMEKLDPSTIESISVLKDSTSIKVYGKRGANGVILVNTQRGSKTKIQNKEISFSQKTTSTDAVPDFPVSGTVVDEQGRPKAGVSIIVPNTNHGTITDINGHFSLKAMKDGNLWFSFIGYKPVKASVSSTMNIRMEQEVVDLFPELSGSVKNGNSGFKVNNGVTVHGIKGEEPLVIIDGKETMEKDALSKLAPDHIKSISVLKDKSAQVVYGDKGKNGVIIVEMLTDDEYQARQNKR